MMQKSWLILLLTGGLLFIFTRTVLAQSTTAQTGETGVAQIQPWTTVITQQVPVSLTLRLPLGPLGVQTVTVPVILKLNLQIGMTQPTSHALTIGLIALQPQAIAPPTIQPATPAPATPTPPAPQATSTPIPLATTAPITSTPTVTATPTVTPTRVVIVAPQCPSPGTVLVSPGLNQVVSGTVPIRGTAASTNFDYYKLEYAVGANATESAAEYRYFDGSHTPVENAVLGTFDARGLPNRAYTLRLTVVDKTGNFPPPCQVTVLVKNP